MEASTYALRLLQTLRDELHRSQWAQVELMNQSGPNIWAPALWMQAGRLQGLVAAIALVEEQQV